jgi:hypothetical protein
MVACASTDTSSCCDTSRRGLGFPGVSLLGSEGTAGDNDTQAKRCQLDRCRHTGAPCCAAPSPCIHTCTAAAAPHTATPGATAVHMPGGLLHACGVRHMRRPATTPVRPSRHWRQHQQAAHHTFMAALAQAMDPTPVHIYAVHDTLRKDLPLSRTHTLKPAVAPKGHPGSTLSSAAKTSPCRVTHRQTATQFLPTSRCGPASSIAYIHGSQRNTVSRSTAGTPAGVARYACPPLGACCWCPTAHTHTYAALHKPFWGGSSWLGPFTGCSPFRSHSTACHSRACP